MDWKEIGKKLLELGLPLLGQALAGPAGGSLGALVASALGCKAEPAAVAAAITQDPQAAVKLREIESQERIRLKELVIRQAELESQEAIANINAVNATMQVEAKSEHWAQYTWRPFNGFTYPAAVILIYFLLPLLRRPVPTVPEWIWIGWLSILGVAAWHRGRMQRTQAGETEGLVTGVVNALKK